MWLAVSAMPRPVSGAGAASRQAGGFSRDTDRKWEFEFHGGGTMARNSTGGSPAYLQPGQPFRTIANLPSRRVSSWYIGDGGLLLNAVNEAFGFSERIRLLDTVAVGRAGQPESGGSFGLRLGRDVTSRLGAELTVDYSLAHMAFGRTALAGIEASRATFVPAMTAPLETSQITELSVTSTSSVSRPKGQLFITGVLNVSLRNEGRFIPYVSGGAGVIREMGDSPAAILEGNYRFVEPAGIPIDESDTVVLRIAAPAFVGVAGGGIRYYVSPRWGLRGDVRVYIDGNADNRLDLTPQPADSSSSNAVMASFTAPSLQFVSFASNNPSAPRSSLSGPRVRDYRSFAGSGIRSQVNLTAGIFWKF